MTFEVEAKLEMRVRGARWWLLLVARPAGALFGNRVGRAVGLFGVSRLVRYRMRGPFGTKAGPWTRMDPAWHRAMLADAEAEIRGRR